jgi:predicted nucleic acid-binding Zn ribbon protein
MPFQGLQSLLNQIERQYQSPTQRHWRSLIAVWPQIIGAKLATQTRPTNIRTQVLQVAVANPILVQTLMFDRPRILQQLNQHLNAPGIAPDPETTIIDLRFSTTGWYQTRSNDSPYNEFNRWDHHPCQQPQPARPQPQQIPLFNDPQTTFDRWASQVQHRDQNLPLCPQCQAPALQTELDRWGYCSLCYSQHATPSQH